MLDPLKEPDNNKLKEESAFNLYVGHFSIAKGAIKDTGRCFIGEELPQEADGGRHGGGEENCSKGIVEQQK